MTPEDVFHAETLPYGGRLAYERGEKNVRRVYEEVAEGANQLIAGAKQLHPQLPEIHFDFFFNGGINALAFRANDRYFIGLSSGAFYMLRFVIGRMLSDARLFGFVGDPSVERSDLGPVTGYAPDAEVLHALYQAGAMETPKDPIRRTYAHVIQQLAIAFLIGHEIAHITRGHVDYLDARKQQHAVSEFVSEKLSGEDLLERQCLEQDADFRSLNALVRSLEVYFAKPTPKRNPWRPDAKHPFAMFVELFVALNIVFQLFGNVFFDQYDLKNSVHPPIPLRRAACEVYACVAFGALWGRKTMKIATEWVGPIRREMDRAFSILLGRDVDQEGLRAAFSEMGRLHEKRLTDYWQTTLLERLKPYSYEPLS